VRKVRVQQASLSDKPLPKGRPGRRREHIDERTVQLRVQDELLDLRKNLGRVVIQPNDEASVDAETMPVQGRDPASIALRIAAQEIRLAHVGQRISIERLQADEHIDTTSPLEPGEQLLVIG